MVTYMAIEDKEAVSASISVFCKSVKIPDPIYANLVRCIAVWASVDAPIREKSRTLTRLQRGFCP